MKHITSRNHRVLSILFILVAVPIAIPLLAASSHALTICSGPCSPVDIPIGGGEIVLGPEVSIPPPPAVVGFLVGFDVPAGSGDISIQVDGDIVITLASGSLIANEIDLRSAGRLSFGASDSFPLSVQSSRDLRICTSECERLDPDAPVFEIPESFDQAVQIRVLGPIDGNFSVYARGDLTILPVPEPGTTLLLGLGLMGLAVVRRRGESME